MAIDLATNFLPYVDEKFATTSKTALVTNGDFQWTGAHAVKVYSISTAGMNDYDRDGKGSTASRYGAVEGLDATTQEMMLRKDRSFTFAIDKLDSDETKQQLQAASALDRQLREVVVPEVDTYVFNEMVSNAGIKPAAVTLTAENIFDEILKANNAMDNAEVPETGRHLIVTPDVYVLLKRSPDIVLATDIGEKLRIQGVIATIDGANVIKVPANRLPANFGFMLCHSCATCAPVKLADYTVHPNPPGISGSLVEGRIAYDAFVLNNKNKAIYYQAQASQ